ncbi:serine/threonine-protein kinase [Streptomyces sp. HNM0575]|uniref:serine/threonine-protein kinase n=1 Tax=Streptomyces sp. HNM0575 TaxID=2716338 RepID=UPI0019D04745|nr:serine/threonine-protein kinase [Streptomyces sp. HNM0575]
MEPLRAGDPRTAGPYRLTFRLGSGGMGRVFLGESPAGRRVAVKVVREDLASAPGFRDRFRREAKLAMRAGGFWAAQVVDADPDAAVPWIASQYVDGPSLAERVRQQGPLDESEVRRLGMGLAEALASFHKGGLVHRDLKPSNVLLLDDGPRVIDFGISKALETLDTSVGADLTRAGTVLGTPGFMSPEQALGRPAGPPSDVFSLGSLLVHAATGAGPFGDGSSHALLFRVVYEAPELGEVPYGLRELAADCLRKSPEERPSADELIARLAGRQPPTAPDPRLPAQETGTGPAQETGTDLPPEATGGGPHAEAATTGPQRAGSLSPTATTGTSARRPAPPAHQSRPPAGAQPEPVAALQAFEVEEWGYGVFWRRMRRPVVRASAIALLCLLVGRGFGAFPLLSLYGFLGALVYLFLNLRAALPLLRARALRVGPDGLHVRQGRHMLTVPWRDIASVTYTREKRMRELALTVALEKEAGTEVPQQLSTGEGVLTYSIVSPAREKTHDRAAGLETALRGFGGGRFQQELPAAR